MRSNQNSRDRLIQEHTPKAIAVPLNRPGTPQYISDTIRAEFKILLNGGTAAGLAYLTGHVLREIIGIGGLSPRPFINSSQKGLSKYCFALFRAHH